MSPAQITRHIFRTNPDGFKKVTVVSFYLPGRQNETWVII